MDEAASNNVSRAEKAFVGVLLAVAVVAVTATVLHANGVWFSGRAAQFVYQVLWTALWLPGIGMFLLLSLRKRRVSLVSGLLLQIAATALYWVSEDMIGLAGALGFLGLCLPLAARSAGKTRVEKAAWPAFFLAWLVIMYCDPLQSWPANAVIVALLWVPYAGVIWPRVGEDIEEAFRKDAELMQRSRAYRCFHKATTVGIVICLMVLVALAALYVYWALLGLGK